MRGQDLIIDQKGIQDIIKRVIKPLWNAYNCFVLYANVDNFEAKFDITSRQSIE